MEVCEVPFGSGWSVNVNAAQIPSQRAMIRAAERSHFVYLKVNVIPMRLKEKISDSFASHCVDCGVFAAGWLALLEWELKDDFFEFSSSWGVQMITSPFRACVEISDESDFESPVLRERFELFQ